MVEGLFTASDSRPTDLSEMAVANLQGTELEWSTISADQRTGGKKKACMFCGFCYLGGPSHNVIRNHLDPSEKRNVSAIVATARAGMSYVDAQTDDTRLPHRTAFTSSTILKLGRRQAERESCQADRRAHRGDRSHTDIGRVD